MEWLMAAAVGSAGGASMEAVDIVKAVKWHRQMPWNVQSDTIDPPRRSADLRPGEEGLPAPGWKAYCVAGMLRLFVSGALPGVAAATYPQSTNPLVAFLVGLGALSAVQQATTLVPLMVKSVGRAALGGVVGEAQQQAQIETHRSELQEQYAKFRAEHERLLREFAEQRARADEEARLKAEEEARLKAEEEARLKAESDLRLSNGHLPRPQTGSHSVEDPLPDTGVPAEPDMTGGGGAS
ncbi:hypothetical protein ACFVXA_14990 [Streptomyces sp. NPDC058246]|uniref:hypothetical protein n=1 Tax=Streptomyces sp. NPDC058246 TaxID=3346400 RepID=UPI0036EE6B68